MGAKAVALGVANLLDPGLALSVLEGIEKYLQDREIEDLEDLVGKVK